MTNTVTSTRQDYYAFLSLSERVKAWKIDAIRSISAWIESVQVIDCPMIRVTTPMGTVERIRITSQKELEVDLTDGDYGKHEC